jgi:hypothetical protein
VLAGLMTALAATPATPSARAAGAKVAIGHY